MDSPSRANANSTAKTGANPLIAPAMGSRAKEGKAQSEAVGRADGDE